MKKLLLFIFVLISIGFIACAQQTPFADLPEKASTSGTDEFTTVAGGAPYRMSYSTLFTNTYDSLQVIRDSLDNYYVLINDSTWTSITVDTIYFGDTLTLAVSGSVDIARVSTADGIAIQSNFGAKMEYEAPSSTNPVFTFLTDENTGMSRAGADTVSIITGGTERVKIASASTDISNVLKLSGISEVQTAYNLFYNASTKAVTYGDSAAGGSVSDSTWISISTDTVNEYTDAQGVTIDGLNVKDGDVNIATTDYLYLDGGGDTRISEAGANVIGFSMGGVGSVTFRSTGIQSYTVWPVTTKLYDLGTTTYWWDNLYIDRVYIDDLNTYLDINSGDMTFTDTNTGTKTLAELAAGGAGSDTIVIDSVAHMLSDSICFPFGLGVGIASDTILFEDESYMGGWRNEQDTCVALRVYFQAYGTSANVPFDILYADSTNHASPTVIYSGTATTIRDSTDIFTNNKIPRRNRIWAEQDGAASGTPVRLEVDLLVAYIRD